jgi:hypothetical protein
MKKIIFLSVLIAVDSLTNAQNKFPRYGITPNNDNTGRGLTWGYIQFKSPSNDSLKTITNYYNTYIQETDTLKSALLVLVDTLHQYIPASIYLPGYYKPLQNTYVGDVQTFQFSAGAITAGRTVTFGSGYASSGPLVVTKNQTANISFIFDSSNVWRELFRTVE